MDLYQLLIFLFNYQGGFTPKMIFLLFCLLLCSCLTAVVGQKEFIFVKMFQSYNLVDARISQLKVFLILGSTKKEDFSSNLVQFLKIRKHHN